VLIEVLVGTKSKILMLLCPLVTDEAPVQPVAVIENNLHVDEHALVKKNLLYFLFF